MKTEPPGLSCWEWVTAVQGLCKDTLQPGWWSFHPDRISTQGQVTEHDAFAVLQHTRVGTHTIMAVAVYTVEV